MNRKSEIHVLGSGSRGNAILLNVGETCVLVDGGFTEPEIKRRLQRIGRNADEIGAVIVTHSHGDHCRAGTARMCERHSIPIHYSKTATRTLFSKLPRFRKLKDSGLAVSFERDEPFLLGDISVEAFELPHDARGGNVGLSVRYSHNGTSKRVAIATDLGTMPKDCLRHFIEANTIVLESNHDEQMLLRSGRPAMLIERIMSDWGHLSNRQSSATLKAILEHSRPGTVEKVFLAHISEECNDRAIVLKAARNVLRDSESRARVLLTHQDKTVCSSL